MYGKIDAVLSTPKNVINECTTYVDFRHPDSTMTHQQNYICLKNN